MTSKAGSIAPAVLLALTAVATTACGTASAYLTPSGSTTTLMQGWDHWFKLDWSVDSEPGGGKRIRGYITNEHGEAAEPLRLLAQALDASDAVVGQKIAWVPEGVGGFERAYFDILSDYSFLQAEADPRDPFK